MTKLDNKGFAITGILYTLFILFLLILVSVLGGLSTKKNMLEQSITVLEDGYLGVDVGSEVDGILLENLTVAPVDGRYKFLSNDGTEEKECYSYLKKGTYLTSDTITYIPNDCNQYLYPKVLKQIISFEKE